MSLDDANFRATFDRKNPNFHNGITTAVPIGEKKIPASMMGEYVVPEGPDLSKLEYGEEYDKMMAERTLMNKLKPALSAVNRQVACMLVDLTKEKPKKDLKGGLANLEEFTKHFPKDTEIGEEIAKVLEKASSEPNDELAKNVHKLTTTATRKIIQVLSAQLKEIKKIKKVVQDKARAEWKAEKDKEKGESAEPEEKTAE